ncbi:hypothetical protein LSTR_LSTR012635 [Laodelphax striatellus]|uniref:Elongation of very long chain fatty acids protein n=1 Tax=Laodelphax striatellus TaxID=195883 RepID=A0A482XQZ4_LAOST|nr:hypothetical protein LSTR_LSTR012635 [Laodelphax striatellus]
MDLTSYNSSLSSLHMMDTNETSWLHEILPYIEHPQHKGDTDHWLFLESPYSTLVTAAVYLAFTLRVGPWFMENRKPMSIKYILIFYNAILSAFSTLWVLEALLTPSLVESILFKSCHLSKQVIFPELSTTDRTKINILMWLYYFSKLVELMDTVLFIIRKKQSQVTFLHVYHHTNMAICTWFFLKYNRNEQIMLIGIMNSVVHAIMYFYYMLSAMGPAVQKYLWWKKYLTSLQLLQFVVLISYYGMLLLNSCDVSRSFTVFSVFNTFSFLFLFLNFYWKTYLVKQKPVKKD